MAKLVIKIASANIKNNPDIPHRSVLKALRFVMGLWSGIIGFQEIGEADDHRALRQVFKKRRGWRKLSLTSIPIVYKTWRFAFEDAYYVKAHKGISGVTPHRGCYVALLQSRFRFRNTTFAVINLHMINRKARRDDLWWDHWRELQEILFDLRSRGISAFVLGDFNKLHLPDMTPKLIPIHSRGLDHIFFVEAPTGLHLHEIRQRGHIGKDATPTDHPIPWAVVSLKKAI